MRFLIVFIASVLFSSVSVAGGHGDHSDGMINVKSNHSVAKTADKLTTILEKKGMKLFARVDHAAGAASVGKTLRPTQLVIFGNPKVGSPIMQCAQTAAIDLPQKMLIWEDEAGQVWLTYNVPAYLAKRHKIQGCDEVLGKVKGALAKFAAKAAE